MFCPSCGTEVPDNSRYCLACGKSPAATISASEPRAAIGSQSTSKQISLGKDERILLDEMGIKVTSARFMVDRQTYAMGGITSVKTEAEHPSKLGPFITIFFGCVGILNGMMGGLATQGGVAFMGLIVLGVGVLWLRSKRSEYVVLLTSASGETKAYESEDGVLVGKIVRAINDAIVHRG